jgi:hypothetical protein
MALSTAMQLASGLGTAGIGALAGATAPTAQLNTSGLDSVIGRLGQFGQTSQGMAQMQNAFSNYQSVAGGPFADQAFSAQNGLAGLYSQYQQTGGLPTGTDLQASNQFATQQFQPQRVAMQQAFEDQIRQANQQAALAGRSQNDPILRAKLAQEQTRQMQQLEAQQGALAGQTAFGLSDRRLQYAEGRANVLTGQLQQRLGMAQNIFGFGQQLQQAELAPLQLQGQLEAAKLDPQAKIGMYNAAEGGSFSNALKGGIAGLGAGMKAFSYFGGKN